MYRPDPVAKARAAVPAVLGLVLLLAAVPARAERFTYRFKPGQVVESRSSMAAAMLFASPDGRQVRSRYRVVTRQVQRVRSVAGGVVTMDVVETPLTGETTGMGRTEPVDRTPSHYVVRMTERGRIVSRKALDRKDQADSSLDGADALYGLNFPERDLKPGETWEDTLTLGDADNPKQVHVRSRFVGMVSFLGRKCARFNTTLAQANAEAEPVEEGVSAQGKLTASVTTYFDPVLGQEIYSSGSLTTVARADLSSISPDGGSLASATRINFVQRLTTPGTRR